MKKKSPSSPLNLDGFTVHEPSPGKPILLFLHGHAATALSFTDPLFEYVGDDPDPISSSPNPTLSLPFDFLLTRGERVLTEEPFPSSPSIPFELETPLKTLPGKGEGLFHEFKTRSPFNLMAYSQKGRNRTVEESYQELKGVIQGLIPDFSGQDKILLIGHSRGGILGRLYLQREPSAGSQILGLIQIGSPNGGSRVASVVSFLAKLVDTFKNFSNLEIPNPILEDTKKKIARFASSEAIKELEVKSSITQELENNHFREEKLSLPLIHFLGDNPHFNTLYKKGKGGAQPEKILSLFDSFPDVLKPSEIITGKGDGCVALKRGHCPHFENIICQGANHATLLIDQGLKTQLFEKVKGILKPFYP